MERPLHIWMRTLARYSEWANGLIYDACVRLSRDAYHAAGDGAGESVHALLNRMLVLDRVMQARLDGYDPVELAPDAEQHRTFARMRDALVAEDVAITERVRHLSEAALALPVSYVDAAGIRHTNSQGELLLELLLCQEGTRGSIYYRLQQCGVSSPASAYTDFLRLSG